VQVTHMTYAEVRAGVTPLPPALRPSNDGIDAFLGDVIAALRYRTDSRKTVPGAFTESVARDLFQDLYNGPEEAFLAAADTLAKRLVGKMNGATAEGLLVCLRAEMDSDRYGGVLKLEVAAKHAGMLRRVESGELELTAISDVLENPVNMQKGALMASWLPDQQVMVGDRLRQDAVYFPAAFGIQTFDRPSRAADALVAAVRRIAPNLVVPVAEELVRVRPGPPEVVLKELGERVSGLNAAVQADLVGELKNQDRPVGHIDTGRRVTETIRAGNITISGPVADMHRLVRISGPNDPELTAKGRGWSVVVITDSEPEVS
jgi:hypothetical protein